MRRDILKRMMAFVVAAMLSFICLTPDTTKAKDFSQTDSISDELVNASESSANAGLSTKGDANAFFRMMKQMEYDDSDSRLKVKQAQSDGKYIYTITLKMKGLTVNDVIRYASSSSKKNFISTSKKISRKWYKAAGKQGINADVYFILSAKNGYVVKALNGTVIDSKI